MFSRILIANRGEIACRIMKTAQRLGIATVAVHSRIDSGALHVEMADQAVAIGGPSAAESYLDGAAIIEAARASGAEAIHPGYGFLSENPDFAEAVTAAGLVFIGPSADAMRAMGLKGAAKALMARAGVPVVPGYHGENQSGDRLQAEARAIGYPVLIKAVAGGGGKGMRRVDGDDAFADALAHARSEARAAFGNDTVLIEKYVETPRHVEVQIFGDGTDAVHLFERDCSLQRRHQKVIEESPAPGMTARMRAAMGEAAVAAARAIGYAGAGTVEFIADASDGLRPDRFWFMEMNTRLQVEHPVSEAVTGIDLVEWQLRIAAGEPLPRKQSGIALSGHAIEARLYAEDVPAGFLPATGRIRHLSAPGDVRFDSGVRAGDVISPYYDPMIAKVIVAAGTRAQALRRLGRALAGIEIAGLVTNLAFLSRLVADPDFTAGTVDTGLIERRGEALTADPGVPREALLLAIVAAAGLDGCDDPLTGFSLWNPVWQSVTLETAAGPVEARVAARAAGRFDIRAGGEISTVERRGDAWWVDNARLQASLLSDGGDVSVFWRGAWHFRLNDPLDRDALQDSGGSAVLAPMPGLVKSLEVGEGDRVARGQKLLTLEAMKMEHALQSPADGVVDEVLAGAGTQVQSGDLLIRLETGEPEA